VEALTLLAKENPVSDQSDRDREVDIASDDSFPASDAPSHTPVTGAGHAHAGTPPSGSWRKRLAGLGGIAIALAAGAWIFRHRR
jgi:hypothetical protein